MQTTNTREMKEQALALLNRSSDLLLEGNVDGSQKMTANARALMEKAEATEQHLEVVNKLQDDFGRTVNQVPVTSNDVKNYNPNDTTASIKADYKPQTWIKGLPAMAQPTWVQKQAGDNIKEQIKFQTDAWQKWFRAPSEDAFKMSATPDEMKAMQEDTDAEGGFFVPEQFIANTIHDSGVPGGQLRPLSTVVRVSSKDGYMPTLASATWAAIAEEAAFSDQTPAVGQVSFSLKKSGGLIKVTRELLDDSAVNLPSELSKIFLESAGRFEDVGIISGNGSTQYAGIMSDGDVGFYTMANATSIVAADLVGTFYELDSQFRANATWVMKWSIASLINQIQLTGNGVTGITDITAAPSAFILGRPNVTTDVVSGLGGTITSTEKCAIFGDFRNYYIFDRVGFTIRRNDFENMSTDQVGFYATRRGDGQVGLANAFKIPRAA